MFTGLNDSAHGVVDVQLSLAEEHYTLAERLRDAGYQTAGFFGGPFLHPTFGMDQGFSTYLNCMTTTPDGASEDTIRGPAHDASHRDITGPRTLQRFGQWLASADDRPVFAFLHLWDVHFDYIPPSPYDEMFDPDYTGAVDGSSYLENPSIKAGMPPRDLRHVIALYDGEIRFTDDIIKQLLDKIDGAERLSRALIVVTSDHGEEFFEHGMKGHQKTLFDEVVRVPLVVRWPGRIQPGGVIHEQVRLIDLMPTLLALAGVPLPMPVQGRDLSPLLLGDELPAEPALLELLCFGARTRALRTRDYKVMVDERSQNAVFFDLKQDPGEKKVQILSGGQDDPRAESAMTELRELVQVSESWTERPGFGSAAPAELDDEMIRRLRSLGYLGGGEVEADPDADNDESGQD
jgi:arylsulfatase A-like enzyme